MSKFKYPDSLSTCPYCGEMGKPCSEITSMARAYARAACRKKYDGVTVNELSNSQAYDPDPDV